MSEANQGKPLAGKGIVVTRPAHQAGYLAESVRAAGGNVILFPAIEIVDVEDKAPLFALLDRLDEFAWAVFVSPNAVGRALNLIKARRTVPPALRFAAIGRASVRELNEFGATAVIAPARFDSEALLDLPEMKNVAGKRIVVFRGAGGRDLLGDTLAARGAAVEYAECYRRSRPLSDTAPLFDAWARDKLHAITVTSSDGLKNLFSMIGARGHAQLRATPLFVPHARIAATARELEFTAVVLTAQGDDGLLAGLKSWFAARAGVPKSA